MGAGSSKPEGSTGSKHVFTSNAPVQFSSNLVEALQTNTETDSSRAKSLELQIQARVAQELERLREREQQTLAEIEKRLAEVKDSAPAAPSSTPNITYPAGSLNLDAPRIPFAGREYESTPAPTAAADQPINRDLSRESVNAEIEQLRAKLEGRRKLVEVDERVERARNEVATCLRLHDRRPLDCWKEVEGFKREVARLEEAFVDRVVG
jgi:altered-inheritance-of-mitochondria protein 13